MQTFPIPQAFALALEHYRAGRLAEAEMIYRQILAVEPNHVDALHHLGIIASHAGRHDQAVELISRAIDLDPKDAGAHSTLANAYRKLGRLDESIAGCRRAIQLDPARSEPHSNLGLALIEQGLPGEAADAFRRAVELQPESAEGHHNLGNALGKLGQLDEAVSCHRRAVALRPDFADAHFSLGVLLLLRGEYEEGWCEYEWRLRTPAGLRAYSHFRVPQWDGKRVIGKTILVHAEQGFGDTLQFVRYLPLVRTLSRATQVVLACQPALVPLLAQLQSPDIEIVASDATDQLVAPFDLHLPLLSMPLALECFRPTPPKVPYLKADDALRARWRARLGLATGPRVGLAWAGNPANGADRQRSIPPEKLAPILRMPGIRFISLQVEPGQPLPPALAAAGGQDFSGEIANFADSAALLAELDLIITVDTSTAHLAGALGRPVWVLLSAVADWRWGLVRSNTPWYPSMHLFRQTTAGDWDEVLGRVAAAMRPRRV